jgi:hypothetical protein
MTSRLTRPRGPRSDSQVPRTGPPPSSSPAVRSRSLACWPSREQLPGGFVDVDGQIFVLARGALRIDISLGTRFQSSLAGGKDLVEVEKRGTPISASRSTWLYCRSTTLPSKLEETIHAPLNLHESLRTNLADLERAPSWQEFSSSIPIHYTTRSYALRSKAAVIQS